MAKQGALRRAGWLRIARDLDPFRATWRLFTNVRWAIGIIAFLALASLMGVVVPQMPANVRDDPAAEAQWLAERRESMGFVADIMERLGLFDVFHAQWFVYALGLLVVSVAVCTASRLPPIWRAVTRPRKRVPDAYFDTARHRFAYATPAAGSRLEDALRKSRYAVETYQEGDTTYLFADRFQFAQLATFVSHLALIAILAAALVSRFTGFSTGIMVAEGSTAPVFPLTHSQQMQVEVRDAVGRFSPQGQPLEYSSDIALYRDGELVKTCTSTVNSPCTYDGYRFHQAAYFGFGADVQIRDLESGNVIFRETMQLSDTLPSPQVVVKDAAGRVFLDDALVLTEVLGAEDFTYYGSLVQLPQVGPLTIGVRSDNDGEDWKLAVFEPGEAVDAVRLILSAGETASDGGLEVTYAGLEAVPAAWVRDFPLPPAGAAESGNADVLMQMSNVVYGTDTASEGTAMTAAGDGPARLTIAGVRPQAVTLESGQSRDIGGYEYTFLGQREYAGIQVKKDRSDYLVWAGAAMLIGGLLVTFWVPRRRIWAKITPGRTHLAGQAGHLVRLEQEMVDLARREGARPEGERDQESDD